MAIERTQEASADKEKGLAFLATNGRPIPGQSLTSNPDEPRPFEKPTRHVELSSAIDALYLELSEPEAKESVLKLMNDQVPVGNLAQVILTDGFQKGMWNPDLMLLLIEPTMYILISLAEQAGIDYKTYEGEENEPSDPEDQLEGLKRGVQFAKENFNIQSGTIPEEILAKLKETEAPEQPNIETQEQPTIETQEQPSLLSRGEV